MSDSRTALQESGVELFTTATVSLDEVAPILEACSRRYDASYAARPVPVATFAIDGSVATVSLRSAAPRHAAVAAAFFGSETSSNVRVAVETVQDASEARLFAESTLIDVIAAFQAQWPTIAVDDNGTVYDPVEISILSAQGETRGASFAFLLEETRRSARTAGGPPGGFAPLETAPLPSPVDALPDVRTERALVFGISGKRLPLVDGVRIMMGVSGDPRLDVDGRMTIALAPELEPDDADLVAALGARVASSEAELAHLAGDAQPQAAGTTRLQAVRDELLLLAPASVSIDEARVLIDAFCGDLNAGAALSDDSLVPAEMQSLRLPAQTSAALPLLIAALRGPGTAIDVYYVDTRLAAPAVSALLTHRIGSTPLAGQTPGFALAIEVRASGPEAFVRADVIATALSAFLSEFGVVATDASGAVYGGAELRRLAATRRGRPTSWTARVNQLTAKAEMAPEAVTA